MNHVKGKFRGIWPLLCISGLTLLLFIVGLATYTEDVYEIQNYGKKNILEYVTIILISLCAFFIILHYGTKLSGRKNSLIFHISSIALLLFCICYGREPDIFESHIKTLIFLVIPFVLTLPTLIYNRYDLRESLIPCSIITVIIISAFLIFNGPLWAIIISLSYSITIISVTKNNLKIKRSLKILRLLSIIVIVADLLCVLYGVCFSLTWEKGYYITNLISEYQNVNFIGCTAINPSFIQNDKFSLALEAHKFGLISVFVTLSILVMLIVLMLKFALKIKNSSCNNIAVIVSCVILIETICGMMNEVGPYIAGQHFGISIMPFLSHEISYLSFNFMLLAIYFSSIKGAELIEVCNFTPKK